MAARIINRIQGIMKRGFGRGDQGGRHFRRRRGASPEFVVLQNYPQNSLGLGEPASPSAGPRATWWAGEPRPVVRSRAGKIIFASRLSRPDSQAIISF